MESSAYNELVDDDLVMSFINGFFNIKQGISTFKVSVVPAYAPDSGGFDKTFRSLIEDVIFYAFQQTGLPDSSFDMINLCNDEPCTYDHNVAYTQKLLIGKSQEDLKWMFENDTGHFGVRRVLVSADSLQPPDSINAPAEEWARYHTAQTAYGYWNIYSNLQDTLGRRTHVYNDTFYLYDFADSSYKEGLNALIADNYRRRVQHVLDFLPNVRCAFWGDVMDPEHIGGYFQTSGALQNLSVESVSSGGIVTPITEKLVFIPWLYPNSFTHELEGEFDSAKINTSVTNVLLGLSAGWLGCEVLFPDPPFPRFLPRFLKPPNLLKLACQAGVAKWSYDRATSKNSVDLFVSFYATGGKYHLDRTLQHFVDNKFPIIFVSAMEKNIVASHTLAQLVKAAEEPAKFSAAQRDSFMLGYAVAAWDATWNGTNSPYSQHYTFNNLEILSSIFGWHNSSNSTLIFGGVQRSRTLNTFWSRNLVSVVDYFACMKDLYNAYIADSANAIMRSANFFDAIDFCNKLSIREGYTPVYTMSEVQYNSLWNTERLNLTVSTSDVRGPAIVNANVYANMAADGYRLPTAAEILSLTADTTFITDPTVLEWIWLGDTTMPGLYIHSIKDTFTTTNLIYGNSFRVIRRNRGLPKLAVFSKDEGIGETNISKPRVYVQNGSNVQLSKFTVHYYFTVENGKVPVLDQYWVPGSNLALQQVVDSLYEIQYYYNGILDTGNTVLPALSGNVVGIHYTDWAQWNKTNDYSFNNSSVFIKNENIVITDSTGFVIYGTEPTLISPVADTGTAQPVLSVYSRDEALNERNMSKPRIFIQNIGAGTLSQFTLHYYFTVENGKTPVVDQYWVPGSAVSLRRLNTTLYEIQYYFAGELGLSGAILPDMSGNVVGIHYSDWSNINKTNDYSFINSSTFVSNAKIAVTNSAGELIYGTMP
jgi:hypothetical protein